MTPEWIAVPSLAMGRWLALELAGSLGASRPGAGDGVAANITFGFPGGLSRAVLEAGTSGEIDPWQVDSLVWAILEVLGSGGDDDRLGPLTWLAPGATWFGRARRLADLFDRYAVRRPELVLHWNAGHDVDGTGRPLAQHDRWQPHLWRLVRACIGVPSPPERLPRLLEEVRAGTVALELPPRLAVFGITTLPSGDPFIELLEAVAARHELHLLLLDPSPVTTSRVRQAVLARPGPLPLALLRSEDASDAEARQVRHPLLGSWGRPYRERAILLASAEKRGVSAPVLVEEPAQVDNGATESLLTRLQHDLRSGSAPAGDFELAPGDRSVQVHACHGPERQVQVLRDAILHLLEDDPTLREEDIVVLCPAIDQFAPLVEAGFGTSADDPSGTLASTPRLLYRISDRSLRESYAVLAALDSLLALIAGRFTASEVLEFISLPVVRQRFGLDDDALRTISDWVAQAKVRWGLDGPQRARWGLPADFTANSWAEAIDRVLMGVAVSDDDIGLGPGDIAPVAVLSGDIAVAGRLADLVTRLTALAGDMEKRRCATDWCEALSDAIEQFFEVEDAQQWQLEQLRRIVTEVGDQAVVGDKPAPVELSLGDVRRLLADRLQGAPRRSAFYRGGITVSSLTPLRWLPFRVICLLGLDEAATSGLVDLDGDDLAAVAPLVGDRDPRAEVRQALLEAVLAAGDHLVITRTGHNPRTNREVPNATVLAELRDTISATLSPCSRSTYQGLIETVHPCQPFDERCFRPGSLNTPGPWSFDAGAFAGALARKNRKTELRRFIDGPLPPATDPQSVIDLSDLKRFFKHPVKAFLRERLQLHLLSEDDTVSDDLVTSLDALDHWGVADRLLAARLAGHATSDWERHERALGMLPPGGLGDAALREIEETTELILTTASELGIDQTRDDRLSVEVELRDGTRLVDTIFLHSSAPRPGPALVTCSKVGPKRRLPAWLDLVALVATEPATDWRSVVVGRPEKSGGRATIELVGCGDTAAERQRVALDALEIAVDCYRRGMLEPIPLFATVSYKLHKRTVSSQDWQAFGGGGEGQDEANRLVFGDLPLSELRALPAREYDPPGASAFRAARFAEYLWGAIATSAVETT
jgi:exodeoxyribonuclease V gamma subunit